MDDLQMRKLSPEEVRRYNRQIILSEFGMEGQEKLKNSRVLFIGAGGLGCPALQYLVAAGIGEIGIVDFDLIDVSNLHRQILFNHDDIGKNKAEVAAEKLQKMNSDLVAKAFPIKFDHTSSEIVNDYDLLIDGSDNFPTRYLVNDICMASNKPWVFGSIFKYEGQVAVFNFDKGPNYRSVYPEVPEENSVPNCAQIGVIGVLPGIIGLLMANEAIKMISGIGESLSGKLLVFDSLENNMNIYQLQKKQDNTNISPSKNNMNDLPLEIEFSELEKLGNYILLDIREEWEFEDFNKGGVNIPLNSLPEKIHTLANEQVIVCCCSYGGKSKIAVKLIQDKFPEKEVYSIKNGIEEC